MPTQVGANLPRLVSGNYQVLALDLANDAEPIESHSD
jgi:hypothetical protein